MGYGAVELSDGGAYAGLPADVGGPSGMCGAFTASSYAGGMLGSCKIKEVRLIVRHSFTNAKSVIIST